MINRKAVLSRLGSARNWPQKNPNINFESYIISSFLELQAKSIFVSDELREIGFAYDSSVIHCFKNFFELDVFFQDSIIEEVCALSSRKKNTYSADKFKAKKFIQSSELFFQPLKKDFILKSFFKDFKFKQNLGTFHQPRIHLPSNELMHFNQLNFFIYKVSINSFTSNVDPNASNPEYDFLNFRIKFDTNFSKPFNFVYPRSKFQYNKALVTEPFFENPSSPKVKFAKALARQLPIDNYYIFGPIQYYLSSTCKSYPPRQYVKRFQLYTNEHYGFYNFFSSRYALFTFFSKIFHVFSYKNFPLRFIKVIPVTYINTNVYSYTLYSIIRLKYKYMLSHVIKPIISGVSLFYKAFFILCNGRFTRAQIASSRQFSRGFINFNRPQAPLFYNFRTVPLRYGASTVHIWLHHLIVYNIMAKKKKSSSVLLQQTYKVKQHFKKFFLPKSVSRGVKIVDIFSYSNNFFKAPRLFNVKRSSPKLFFYRSVTKIFNPYRKIIFRSSQYSFIKEGTIKGVKRLLAPLFRGKKLKTISMIFTTKFSTFSFTKKPSAVRMGGGVGKKARVSGFFVRPGEALFTIYTRSPHPILSRFNSLKKKFSFKTICTVHLNLINYNDC